MMKCLQQHTLSMWAWFGTCESDHFAFSCIGYCQRHPLTCTALEIFKNSEPCRFDQPMIDAASPRSGSGLNRSPLCGDAHDERRRCQQTCFWGVLYSWSYDEWRATKQPTDLLLRSFLQLIIIPDSRQCSKVLFHTPGTNGLRRLRLSQGRPGTKERACTPSQPLSGKYYILLLRLLTIVVSLTPVKGGLSARETYSTKRNI